MNPTPTTDTQRLRELLAEATPGPWSTYDAYHIGSNNIRLFHTSYYIGSIGNSDATKVQNEMDAELIAALRNAAPALLDELDDLRQLKKEIDGDGLVPATRVQFLEDISTERDKLREEVERLQKDNASLTSVYFKEQEWNSQIQSQRDSLRRENEELKSKLR